MNTTSSWAGSSTRWSLASRRYRIADRAVVAIGDPRSGGEPINLALTVERPGDPGVTEPAVIRPTSPSGWQSWARSGSRAAPSRRWPRWAGWPRPPRVRLPGSTHARLSPLPQVTHDF
ncbi:MAG: hypothetical protein R2716_07775 [Microthrixaceae bacterium]